MTGSGHLVRDVPIGTRFGKLVVMGRGSNTTRGTVRWHCACDCGGASLVRGVSLRRGDIQNCRKCRRVARRHGHGGNKQSSTYRSWHHAVQRCANTRLPRYADYGGRGISMCDRWTKFENFLADMGERPAGMSLDRIDNDGNYEPGNCRWATPREQAANQREKKNRVRVEGKTIHEWATVLGISYGTAHARYRKHGRIDISTAKVGK